ncbi:MAG TPA: cation:proton antiporter [Anaerolineae bacterium]|nr:cation:proton antiporter [Anaerolineae bacterium]
MFIVGSLVLVLGLFSDLIKRTILSEPLLSMIYGILLSPLLLGFLRGNEEAVFEQASALTLAVGLIDVALRLPKFYIVHQARPLIVLLGLVMPLMWLVSGLLIFFILGLPFWMALLIGAIISPTDPILASSILTGKIATDNIPSRIRYLLSAESGANDGLAYPFVFLPILVLTLSRPEILRDWLVSIVLWQVGGAIIAGALVGYVSGRLLSWVRAMKAIGIPSFLGYALTLSLVALGSTELIGTDGILAVFATGVVFNMTITERERTQAGNFQRAINRFFILPIFALFGSALPWSEWLKLGWKAVALVVAVLLLRRLPAVLVLKPLIKPINDFKDAAFAGWFGPMGVSALYYANLSLRLTGIHEVWVIASLIIFASIIAHGTTATPLARLYARVRGGG